MKQLHLSDKHLYFNRELSWLDFNGRVFEEAADPQAPPLERLKFLAITGSNLDEFFMVRVGGLKLLIQSNSQSTDITGATPAKQLMAINERAHAFCTRQYQCLLESIEPALTAAGLRRLRPQDLPESDRSHLQGVFERDILPLLSPIAIANGATFPPLRNLSMNVAVRLAPYPEIPRSMRYAVVPMPQLLSRVIFLPELRPDELRYVLWEDVVKLFAEQLFPGANIAECVAFRITRNGDLTVEDDAAEELLDDMKRVLKARRTSDCIRLEIENCASKKLLRALQQELSLDDDSCFLLPGPPGIAAFMALTDLSGFEDLCRKPWKPRQAAGADLRKGIFKAISRKDILLVHPYESFEPVQRLVEEAAVDPNVLAIKITLYRTSKNSPILAALCQAAQNGKNVTALVELKARFDEERNIIGARELQDAGVQVLHGIRGFKTHSKICLIVRRDSDGIRRYMHFSTGNYNEITARIYSDVSYFTCAPEYGQDASAFFNAITGYSTLRQFHKLDMAPVGIRTRLLDMINGEISRHQAGQKSLIMIKVNSLSDKDMIDALYRAAKAGVRVMLNVRGICCLRPGVPGLSDNISVVSIVDRFLEHARILYFHRGGKPQVLISSADWMTRNLDRRVELLVPIADDDARKRLISMLEIYCSTQQHKGRVLNADGSWKCHVSNPTAKTPSTQDAFCAEAQEDEQLLEQSRRTIFEPVVPPPRKKRKKG
ncbi:MAG: polyphosphate kinase 1 [Lentisphaeria bacterium]|nr:polyphosphate kinase 1 [Lentisphaeria bacterium]